MLLGLVGILQLTSNTTLRFKLVSWRYIYENDSFDILLK